ncbi:MAG: double zinc ribbon domain-containing protein [Cellulosilyticaceae bacterium]
MECKKCGAVFEQGKFCPKCGENQEEVAVVVAETKNCSHCGAEIKLQAKFCKKCGQSQELTDEVAVQHVEQYSEEGPQEEQKEEQVTTVSQSKKKMIGIGIGCVVVAAIAMTMMSVPKQSSGNNMTAYITQDDDWYMDFGTGKFKEVFREMQTIKYDVGLEHFYMKNADNELFYQFKQGEQKLLAKDVSGFAHSQDGKTAVYIEDYDYNDREGKLVYQVKGKEPLTITKKAVQQAVMSANGKCVLYGEKEDDYAITAYLSKNGDKGVKILDEVTQLIDVFDNGEALVVNTDGELILIDVKGKETRIVKNVGQVEVSDDLKRIYATTMDGELGVYENNKWTELVDGDVAYYSLGEAPMSTKTTCLYYGYDKGVGIVLPNNTVIELKGAASMPTFTDDGQTFYYIDNDNDLQVKTLKGNKIAFEAEVDGDVESFVMVPQSNNIYYINDDSEAYAYTYKKESKKIAKNTEQLVVDAKNAVYFVDEDDVLNRLGKDGKTVEVIDDVDYCIRNEQGKIYVLDLDDNLYEVTKGIETTKVDKDVYNMRIMGTKQNQYVYNANGRFIR